MSSVAGCASSPDAGWSDSRQSHGLRPSKEHVSVWSARGLEISRPQSRQSCVAFRLVHAPSVTFSGPCFRPDPQPPVVAEEGRFGLVAARCAGCTELCRTRRQQSQMPLRSPSSTNMGAAGMVGRVVSLRSSVGRRPSAPRPNLAGSRRLRSKLPTLGKPGPHCAKTQRPKLAEPNKRRPRARHGNHPRFQPHFGRPALGLRGPCSRWPALAGVTQHVAAP